MELKNMNGFCELSENTMMEIDGGARRVRQGSGSVGSTREAFAGQTRWTGNIVTTVGLVSCFVPGLQVVGVVTTVVGAALQYASNAL